MSKDAQTEIAGRFRRAREAAGLSQGQVARKLNMHRPTITEIEAARRRISAEELDTFSDLFGVSTEWLLSGKTAGLDQANERIAIAARQLGKMKPADVDRLMDLLKMIRVKGEDR